MLKLGVAKIRLCIFFAPARISRHTEFFLAPTLGALGGANEASQGLGNTGPSQPCQRFQGTLSQCCESLPDVTAMILACWGRGVPIEAGWGALRNTRTVVAKTLDVCGAGKS